MSRQEKIGIMIAFIISIIFAGCAKNPKDDIVVNKNEAILDKVIHETNDSTLEQYYPDSYKEEFLLKSEKIKVVVDASINASKNKLPVVRVKPHAISIEEAKRWADILFEGKPAYEPEPMTKAQIEKRILELKNYLNDKDELVKVYGDDANVDIAVDILENQIYNYKKKYETAPEHNVHKPCEWKFHSYEYYSEFTLPSEGEPGYEGLEKTQQLIAVSDTLNNHTGMITVTNRDEDDYRLNTLWFNYEDSLEDLPYYEITEHEAKMLGEKLRKDLGLSDWNLYNLAKQNTNDKNSYELLYTPSYEGATSFPGPLIDLKSEDIYAANYYYSSLTIGIENGIITYVELISPMDIVKIENKNPMLMNFEEIYENFKNHLKASLTRDSFIDPKNPEANDAKLEVKITSIDQGLFRIKEKDNRDDYLVVPVWTFNGKILVDGVEWLDQQLVMLNALDGSVINTDLGY